MRWLHPEILWALFALLIPVAIHLFNFRRFKPLYFSNIKWLKEVQLQTKKQSQLKNWLLLLTRLLLFAAVILAFAEPYFPSQNKNNANKAQYVSIYIDNSFSMDGLSENGRMLDIAKQYGYELIDAFGKNTQFQIITNNFAGADRLWISSEEAINRIDEISKSATVKSISQAVQRTHGLIENTETATAHSVYVLSDFQRSISDLSYTQDTNQSVYLIPITPNQQTNLSVDSAWFEAPIHSLEKEISLMVRVRNYSDETATAGITTTLNGKNKGTRSITVPAQSYADSSILIRSDLKSVQNIELSINDSPITYDNRYYLSTTIDQQFSILEIYEGTAERSIGKLFGNDSNFVFQSVDKTQLQLQDLSKQDLIITSNIAQFESGVSQALVKYVSNGGKLAFFPSQDAEPTHYTPFFTQLNALPFTHLEKKNQRLATPEIEHPLYENVFTKVPENWNTPKVQQVFAHQKGINSAGLMVLSLPDQSAFLTEYSFNKGVFYQFAAALDTTFSFFHQHPLFVPTLINMALTSKNKSTHAYTIGSAAPIFLHPEMVNKERLFSIANSDVTTSFIPEFRIINGQPALLTNQQPEDAGFYRLSSKNSDSALLPLAFNFNRLESDPTAFTTSDLQNLISEFSLENTRVLATDYKNIQQDILATQASTPLWKWLLSIALLCLIAELLIIRFYKSSP